MHAHCSILSICWQDLVSNLEILDHAESTTTESLIIHLTVELLWAVICMLCSLLESGKSFQGPCKCHKDAVNETDF